MNCMENTEARQRWQRILDVWGRSMNRIHMREPITLSRCSTIPVLLLVIQSLIICILEASSVPLGTAGGIVQFIVTLVLMIWIVMQLELSDAVLERHGGLTMIHDDTTSSNDGQMLDDI